MDVMKHEKESGDGEDPLPSPEKKRFTQIITFLNTNWDSQDRVKRVTRRKSDQESEKMKKKKICERVT